MSKPLLSKGEKDVTGKTGAEELRSLVARCSRMLEANGLIDYSGHVSSRLGKDTLLIQGRQQSRFTLQPDDLIEVGLNGSQVGTGNVLLPSEVYIHTSIYQARPDVHAIAHLHSPAVITLSIARKDIFPATFPGTVFAHGIPVYDDPRLVNTSERGEKLARKLGSARAVVIRGHGSVIAAESVKALFLACVYFEKNAQRLLEAYRIGNPEPLADDIIAEGEKVLWQEKLFAKVWDYYESKCQADCQALV